MRYILIMAAAAALFSCQFKPLEEPHTHQDATIEVVVTNDFGALVARSSSLIFYPKNGTSPLKRSIVGSKGFVDIPVGDYDITVWTSDFYDLDAILYRGDEQSDTHQAYTRQGNKADNKILIVEPDPLFSLFTPALTVVWGASNRIEAELMPRSYRYWTTIDVQGLELVQSCVFKIEGMLTSVFLKGGFNPLDLEGAIAVDMTLDPTDKKIRGEFYSFGVHPDPAVKNTITLYFVNGKSTTIVLNDITPHIKTLTKGGEIVITQKFIITAGEGGEWFKPEVNQWDDKQVDIII